MNRLHFLFVFCFHMSISVMAQQSAESNCFQLISEDGYHMRTILPPSKVSDTFEIDDNRPISGLSLSGVIILPNSNSFVRIILQDKQGKEYLVLETNRIYNDSDTLLVSNYCEETKNLPNIYPHQLLFYSDKASVNISSVTLKIPNEDTITKHDNHINKYKELFEKDKMIQVEQIVRNINKNNQRHNRLWRAEVTDISLLTWEEKKKILSIDGRCYPTGFEYYSSGIFEFGEVDINQTISRSSSPYVDSFDWRNRHGINWMTSVKNQNTGNGCWAFAAVGVTEALVNLYFNQKIDYNLSEQEVISCSGCGTNTSGGYEGCALNWISYHGISEEDSFPFSNSDEPCSNKGNFNELITMNGTAYVQSHTINNNDSVKKALIKYGPMTSGFMYDNGSYHGHCMTLVGYATLHEGDTIRYFGSYNQSPNNFVVIQNGDNRIGKTYWIFKNSYGTDRYFEHKGYAYVLFNDQSCFRTPYYAKVPIISQIYLYSDIVVSDADGDGYYFWGIGPKPANCPSWVPDTPDGDDSNINLGAMDEYGNLQALQPNGTTINTAVTYSTNQTINNRIGIVKNGTLTITGTTTLSGDAVIRVCENGTLIVDGGTLQNAKLDLIPGSHVVVRNNGTINMASGRRFDAPIGVVVDIQYGSIN